MSLRHDGPASHQCGEDRRGWKNIRQTVDIFNHAHGKWNWLKSKIQDFIRTGNMLIFVASKLGVEKLARDLAGINVRAGLIHGDKTQQERNSVIERFRAGSIKVLVSTDVAARGLDIKGLETVVNFDCAHNLDAHVHRIGRTGRAGAYGHAYTLLNRREERDKQLR
eukprot:TRINITY_DN6045_c0_g1_i1.p2 TRINITY_DN6045_c0_g1~~TRINITY_DN6045_c0_g1_i1.p2  ORF type:complete len:166 (-),score=22.29 TRINITY_DN6045_c0_g1_i1:348-845(-)